MTQNLDAQTLAHDLKSPLTALKLSTYNLSQCQETNTIIHESLKTLERLVQQVGHLGDSSSGASQTKMARPFPIAQKVIQTAKLRYKHFQGLSISQHLDSAASELDATICELEFERALTNLINNAVEALCGRGFVRVILKVKKKTIQLSVVDSGPGIPSHVLSTITSPGVTYGKKHGSGLGLYQAKKAIESSGGRLLISTAEGKGTRIILEIPFISPSLTDELPVKSARKLVSHLTLMQSA